MAYGSDSVGKISATGQDNAVAHVLLADARMDSAVYGNINSLKLKVNDELPAKPGPLAKDAAFEIHPLQLAFAGDGPAQQPKTNPTDVLKKEASSLASMIKSQGARGFTDSNRDEIHSEFHKQLEKSKDKSPAERAAALRAFVGAVNTNLRKENGKFSFSENRTADAEKLSFSLVDKGEGNLVAGIPERTVYDTMDYSVKKGDVAVANLPDRADLPANLRNAYDFVFQASRAQVMKDKYVPALDGINKERGLEKMTKQEDLNKAVGLAPDASPRDFFKQMESLMMKKLGLEGQDYNETYSRDVDRAMMSQLKLKPGIATQADIISALQKVTVPKDFKRDVPKGP